MKVLQDKVAVVTGGSSGIGRATAFAFAQQGARVVIANRRENMGQKTVAQIKDAGGEAVFQKTDVTQVEDIQALIRRAIDTYGKLDIAFNNAGISVPPQMIAEQDEADFELAFDVNVKGVYLGMKYQIKEMLAQGSGVIVNNISTNGFTNSIPGLATYITTKHAPVGLTKAVAMECANSGIRVNGIAPGLTKTEMTAGSHELVEQLSAIPPMKRMGNPDEVANAVVWLCSDAASFVTGHTLVIDGGFMVRGVEL
jgi:NAD(P)-dependent dehydrogenase (short-subunit alcohol dehydrogenase family)